MARGLILPLFQDTINTPRQSDSVNPVALPDQNAPSFNTDSFESTYTVPVISIKPANSELKKIPQAEKKETAVSILKKNLREVWNTSGNFFMENGLSGVVSGLEKEQNGSSGYTGTSKPEDITPLPRVQHTYDWLLGIILFLVVLFVWIRVFYSKFFGTLANALISFQLSVKLFQERNVLLQRVSIVLDFIYVIIFTVFIFEYIEYSGFAKTGMTGFNLFLLLFNILLIYTILRTIILRITADLFLARNLFAEYIHNTFVINKGLGIALFPIIIMGQYLPYKLVPIVLVAGILILGAAMLLKAFRAYQIIIRRDILLFYLILYLCTLEILPLLLGYKFVTSLIQSN
jgi:hypothetical protein